MKTTIFIILLFSSCIIPGHADINKDILDKIEPGYTTLWDIEQLLGEGEKLENYFLSPDIEHERGSQQLIHSDGIRYNRNGISFLCKDDVEYISGIQLRSPFKFVTEQTDTIEVGKTALSKAFPDFDTIHMSTSLASRYWYFSKGKFHFYIAKAPEDIFKGDYQNIPDFKKNLEYYKDLPISIITTDFYEYALFSPEQKKIKELDCKKPLYAYKDETHFNCYEMGWPDNLPVLLIPFYALTGGQRTEIVRQGYWKVYASNHKLAYEGEFKDNKEVGLFKYYDENGRLIKTKDFSKSGNDRTVIIISSIIALFVMIIFIKKRRKT